MAGQTWTVLVGAALLAAASAWGAEVVEFGEFSAEREYTAPPQPGDEMLSPKGVVEGLRLIRHTDTLEGQLCLHFGVVIRRPPDAAPLPRRLTVVSTHPRLTRPDGVSGTRDSFMTATDGDTAYTGWTFEYPWELQAGDWTIAFLDGDEVVASKTFHVTVPRRPGSLCPAPPVS